MISGAASSGNSATKQQLIASRAVSLCLREAWWSFLQVSGPERLNIAKNSLHDPKLKLKTTNSKPITLYSSFVLHSG